jgi:hypothetical protein
MKNTARVIWVFLATLGALGACFSGAIFLTEERASVDILIALVSGGLSYSSITLCVSSLVTTINKLGSGDPQTNSGRIGKCIVSLIVMIVFLIIISIVYSKIISKVLTTQYRLMKTDLEGVKQRLSSEQLASVSDRDKQILQTCEGTRLRQLALQADLIRVKEVIAGQSNTQKLSDEDQTMLHALESKMDKLGDQITELSNICSQLGKVGPSFTEKTVIDTDRR